MSETKTESNPETNPGTDPETKPLIKLSPRWLVVFNTIAVIVLGVLVSMDKLTPEQAKIVETVIPLVVGDKQPQQTPTPLQPQALQGPTAISPEQIKQWIELARLIFDAIKPIPRPEPQPEPQPSPSPQPQPKPQPQPQPDPAPRPDGDTDIVKIVVTDESDKLVTSTTVDPGRLFQVSVTGATGKVGWQVSRHGNVSLIAIKGGGYTFSLQAGAWVEFFATDFGRSQQVSARISANQGPQPPPTPDPQPSPKPQPQPNPQPQPQPDGVTRSVWLYVVYDPRAVTPEAAAIIDNSQWWNQLRSKGHAGRVYTVGTQEKGGLWAISQGAGRKTPYLVIADDKGNRLDVVDLPQDLSAMDAVVGRWSR